MDFLGLRTLTVMQDAEKMIRRRDPDFSMDNISDDDAAVYDMLCRSETEGVFQLESHRHAAGARRAEARRTWRTSSPSSPFTARGPWIPSPPTSTTAITRTRCATKRPSWSHILDVTNGCIVYQEQVMQICRELAGFSLGPGGPGAPCHEQEKARRHGKGAPALRHRLRRRKRAMQLGPQAANDIFDDMSSFASYAFNKSHAAAYALVAYQTAYLKCHYPSEFMAALLTSVLDNTDKVIEYTGECQRLGIQVLPPSINVSDGGFTVDGKSIRFGLNATKNVGRNLIAAVVRERKEKPFTSLYDFCRRLHGRGAEPPRGGKPCEVRRL